MALDVETIMEALGSRFRTQVPSIVFVTRQPMDYETVRPDRQPSLEFYITTEHPREAEGMPPVWTIGVEVFVMARNPNTGGADTTMETTLNQIRTEVEAALECQPGERPDRWGTTLGLNDVVQHCWISGAIGRGQGRIGGQAFLRIPVEIVAVA